MHHAACVNTVRQLYSQILYGEFSGPVNNSQMPAKICSIKNILSH